jgi:AcrR family transcriptional regulator
MQEKPVPSTTPRPRRGELDRDRIVDAALAIGDEEGLEAVTFRRLASALGVSPMALYRHLRSKDELLDALADRALEPLDPPPARRGWAERLEAQLRAHHDILIRHPAAVAVLTTRAPTTPNTLRASEALIGILRGAGFDLPGALSLASELASRNIQLTRLEAIAAAQSGEQRAAAARRLAGLVAGLSHEEFPNLTEATPLLAAPVDPAERYEAGLALLMAGVREQRKSHARRA